MPRSDPGRAAPRHDREVFTLRLKARTEMRPDIFRAHSRPSGFTVIELVIVMVFLGIISAFVVSTAMPRAGQSTVGYQAQQLASDLRHAQMLAMTWGKDLNFTTTSTSYSVSCTSVSAGPCASYPSAVVDPGHSGSFTVALDNVTLSLAPTLTFDIVGKPSSAASFTLAADGVTMATVTVAAGTGFVTVQ